MNDLEVFLRNEASPTLVGALSNALATARQNQTVTTLGHVIDALLDDTAIINRVSGDCRKRAKAGLSAHLPALPRHERPGSFSFQLSAVTMAARGIANDMGADRVTPLAFLVSCLQGENIADAASMQAIQIVRSAGLSAESLTLPSKRDELRRQDFTFHALGFGVDLTAKARAGFWRACPLIGMERQLEQLVRTISASSRSVVLVGEPGVGKSALIDGLSFHIAKETRPLIPSMIDGWSVVMLAARDILAGTGVQGDLEARLNTMLAFFRENTSVIPFFDEVHTLLDTGSPSARAIATALKPPMESGSFRCIGATTDQEYARFIASDPAMNSRFTKILIPEPSTADAVAIMSGIVDHILPPPAQRMGLVVTKEAVAASVEITHRYNKTDRLPRKAKQLLEHVISKKTYDVLVGIGTGDREVTARDVAAVFSDTTGIPLDALDDQRDDFYESLFDRLSSRVKGQETAIKAIISWLRLQASGWLGVERPRGRFLFLGPSGVGKTELAKALAEQIMHDRGSLVVKNMAEFKGEDARNQFMGASAGYVGFGETTTVYSRVMMRPYSVVVLDEIEKAHASLSDPLLSVLDGSAEDAQGRFVDFSQCIFILTSNALQVPDGGDDELSCRRALLQMGGIWQPAFVDRIDRVIVFGALARDTQVEILAGMIDRLGVSTRKPLPARLREPGTLSGIVDAACQGADARSARRLERCLLDWLIANGREC